MKENKSDVEYVFEVPIKQNIVVNSISLNQEIVAKFIGFYLMKIEIPEDIYEHVRDNKDKLELSHLGMFFGVIFGAPIETDSMVRQMAIDFIR